MTNSPDSRTTAETEREESDWSDQHTTLDIYFAGNVRSLRKALDILRIEARFNVRMDRPELRFLPADGSPGQWVQMEDGVQAELLEILNQRCYKIKGGSASKSLKDQDEATHRKLTDTLTRLENQLKSARLKHGEVSSEVRKIYTKMHACKAKMARHSAILEGSDAMSSSDSSDGPQKTPVGIISGRKWQDWFRAVVESSKVDPFEVYLRSLPAWDRTPRVDDLFGSIFHIPTGDPALIAAAASRLTILGAVRRTLYPGCNHPVLPVLIGAQGHGKSSMLRGLLPDPKNYPDAEFWFCDNVTLTDPEKVIAEKSAGAVLIELGEMMNIAKADHAALKNSTSSRHSQHRAAYAQFSKRSPHRSVRVGTSNQAGRLPPDPSGMRRFIPVSLGGTKFPDSNNAEADWAKMIAWLDRTREQLWAEALHRVEELGEDPCRFDEATKAAVTAEAEDNREDSPIAEMLHHWLYSDSNVKQLFTTQEAWDGSRVNEAQLTDDIEKIDGEPDETGPMAMKQRRLGRAMTVPQRRLVEDELLRLGAKMAKRQRGLPPPTDADETTKSSHRNAVLNRWVFPPEDWDPMEMNLNELCSTIRKQKTVVDCHDEDTTDTVAEQDTSLIAQRRKFVAHLAVADQWGAMDKALSKWMFEQEVSAETATATAADCHAYIRQRITDLASHEPDRLEELNKQAGKVMQLSYQPWTGTTVTVPQLQTILWWGIKLDMIPNQGKTAQSPKILRPG